MIQKIGNGAPAPGQLKRGELGLDLSSNVIYSSSNGTDILVMGISEVKWDDITGLPDFILTIDPNNPDYIDISGLEARVKVNEEDIALLKGIVTPEGDDSLAEKVAANTANITTLELTVNGDPDDGDDGGLVEQVEINVRDIAELKAALNDAVTGLVLGGKYDAQNNVVTEVTADGTTAGLIVNQNLPIGEETKGVYVIVTVGGELEGIEANPASSDSHLANGQTAYPGDWLLSDGQHGWILMDFHTDATEWGTIGGTIGNQDDLMAEFTNYLKKTDTIDGGSYTAVRNS
jgi:hypothetical protein